MHELVVTNARLYPMTGADMAVSDATGFGVDGGRVSAVPAQGPGRETFDAAGRVVLPGFVDCHTHAVFSGDRMTEHAALRAGASYSDIAAAGGGIATTVRAVRESTLAELVAISRPRLDALRAEGVTSIEIKSGYGLDHDSELKMLRAIARLGDEMAMDVHATYLGAHTVPAGTTADDYLDDMIARTLPAIAAESLAEFVDIYVEPIAFSTAHMERLFDAARRLGFKRRVHAEQFTDSGAAALAAKLGATSADHLEYLSDKDAASLANSDCVAVLLPGAYYFLGETQPPPVTTLREYGVPMAVATDLNPGSSPLCTLLGAAHMAVHLFGLTPDEALRGITLHAARALGAGERSGHLGEGANASFSVWDIPAPQMLTYQLGGLAPDAVFHRGVRV